MDLSPWESEPIGDGYCYLVRLCRPDRTSSNGFQYPASGYVAAEAWDDKGREDFGLYGLLHGEGSWVNPFILDCEPGSTMVLTVARSEVQVSEGFEARAPRGWVRYFGPAEMVCDALDSEGTEYATGVADRIRTGIVEGAKEGDAFIRLFEAWLRTPVAHRNAGLPLRYG